MLLLFQSGLTAIHASANEKEQYEPFRVTEPTAAAVREMLEKIREIRTEGVAAPLVVELPAGLYEFANPLQLTSEIVGQGLTLRSIDKGEVIFSGGQKLKSLKKDESGRWRYALPDGWREQGIPRALLVNQRLKTAARYPQQGYLRIEKAMEDRRSGFTVQENDLPADLSVETGVCDLILLHDWSSSRIPVASYEAESRELRTVGPIGCAARHYAIDHFEKQPRYWLEGHPLFLKAAGDWIIDREAGEVMLVAGEDSTTAPEVILPQTTEILVAAGTEQSPLKNLVLQDLVFTAARFPMPAGGLAGAQATMHEPRDQTGKRTTSNRPMLDAAVRVELAEGCRVQNCRFRGVGGTGLWVAGRTKNCLVKRCQFWELGGNGLNIGEDNSRRVQGRTWYQAAPEQVPTNNRIEDCEVSDCGVILPGAVGIWAPLNRELQIVNNHLHDCPYTGISLGWIWSQAESPAGENVVSGNRIEYVMQVLSDGGGIYTLGKQPGSRLENNYISDIPLNAGRAESNGMFLDEGSTGFTIQGNTFRRLDRSPLRFHKAGENTVGANTWYRTDEKIPYLRFNNTPEKNIQATQPTIAEVQKRIYLIGNSLTRDTLPGLLDEEVQWHVDCGKSLKYISEHPVQPCVGTSRIWPRAFKTAQYDFLSFQPHYGGTLEDDAAVISAWMDMQPQAVVILHTGWARHESLASEYAETDPSGTLKHSRAYFKALQQRLQEKYPEREFRSTYATDLLHRIQEDISAGKAPLESIEEMYRDAIHMNQGPGRYLMHNAMRQAMGQSPSQQQFPELSEELKSYLDQVLEAQRQEIARQPTAATPAK